MKRKTTSVFAIVLSVFMLLPLLGSCDRSEKGEERAENLVLYRDGVSEYRIVVSESGGEGHREALDRLCGYFTDLFGAPPETVSISDRETAKDEKLIIFGDVGTGRQAELEAAKRSAEGGYCVLASGGDIAFFASSDKLLLEAAELFGSKYVKGKNGDLEIASDLFLCREFTGIDFVDASDYDFGYPVISVVTEGGEDVVSKTKYIPASVSIGNTYSVYALDSVSASIRGRGNGTWTNIPKKPYKLKFGQKVDLLGIGHGADKDWLLLSNPLDYSNLRNAVAFSIASKLFDKIGFVTDFTYVNLFLNGEYKGLYFLCEQVEASSHKIKVDEDPDDISGSEYLIELDYYASYTRSLRKNRDYFEIENKNFVIKSDYNSTERCMHVYYRFRDMFEALESRDIARIAEYIDLPSCVDTYLLHEYLKNTDVGWSSFYMVLGSDGKLYFTAPWDFDLTAGNDSRVDNGSWEGLYVGRNYDLLDQSSPIFYKLMECRDFASLASDRWREIAPGITEITNGLFSDFEGYRSDRLYDMELRLKIETQSMARKNHSSSENSSEVIDDNTAYLRDWLERRLEWMNSYFGKNNI